MAARDERAREMQKKDEEDVKKIKDAGGGCGEGRNGKGKVAGAGGASEEREETAEPGDASGQREGTSGAGDGAKVLLPYYNRRGLSLSQV